MLTLKQLKEEPLVRGSFISIVGAVLIGFGNYLFQLVMGRMLTPAEFGSLSALLSLSIILTVPNQALSLTTTKHVSGLFARKQLAFLPVYARSVVKQILPYGFFLFIVIIAFSSSIKSFLNLTDLKPLYILAVLFLFSFLSPLGMGIYRGIQNFFQSALSQFLSVLVKVILGVALVALGFGVSGALLANLIFNYLFYFKFEVIQTSSSTNGQRKKSHAYFSLGVDYFVSFFLFDLFIQFRCYFSKTFFAGY